jgi:ankyrin repeat protein
MVKLLLEEGADLKIMNNDGWAPLNLALYYGHLKVVRLLLEKGADLNAADNIRWTLLKAAF